jgi:hypothetical protein
MVKNILKIWKHDETYRNIWKHDERCRDNKMIIDDPLFRSSIAMEVFHEVSELYLVNHGNY